MKTKKDSKEKETPVDITANESLLDAIKGISNTCKDTESFRTSNLPDWMDRQCVVLREAFSNGILTMKQASVKTGIDRANICWFVWDLRSENAIWQCGKGIDELTKGRAAFYTTSLDRAVKFYEDTTRDLWQDLPDEDQEVIFYAVRSYVSDRGLGIFISSALSDDDIVLDTWKRIQECIDERMR